MAFLDDGELNGASLIDLGGSQSGPCMVLGSGPSAITHMLEEWRDSMPVLGCNDSWKFYPGKHEVRVFVDFHIQKGPQPKVAVSCLSDKVVAHGRTLKKFPWQDDYTTTLIIRHLTREDGFGEIRFMGFDLDKGTFGFGGGPMAIEFAAWLGHNPIHLIGYDFKPGRRCYNDKDKSRVTPSLAEGWQECYVKAYHACKERGVKLIRHGIGPLAME